MESDPSQLVREFRHGDHAAAVRLIELFYERVYNFLYRLAGSEPDAADLTQQTFTRVWQRLSTFEGRSSVSSWIHGIAYHVYLDWRRKNRRHEERPPEWWDTQVSPDAAPDESLTCGDLRTTLFTRVEELDPDLRAVVHCHYYQELTLQETADALEVSAGTVKNRLRQAVAALQKNLAEPGKSPRLSPSQTS